MKWTSARYVNVVSVDQQDKVAHSLQVSILELSVKQ